MDCKIFTDIPYELTMETLNEELNLRNKKNLLKIVETLLAKTREITRLKAIYFSGDISEKNDISVAVNGESFGSELLRGYVEKGDRVYPYMVTVGTELDEYAKTLTDTMDQIMIDGIMNLLVNKGKVFVAKEVQKEARWDNTQDYVPGNGEAWSTEEQTRLFDMFGDQSKKIGVTLGDHAFVLPGRSTIGILSQKK
ncbi:hypothetical protein [Acetobacterium bakii]|uniref:Uncharacterized protein n=1 Tax=Acetobacterium bakii TaxID=52689 RepID=A0A0L6TYR7_9FIRM|nr:hypothetical protein [Acetobacterium bakii]KNZ41237.1 hypothetical protein AKG39_13035 [Acetobacterium bakii]